MKILFKVLSFLFALLFIFSAVLQYNDPDPIIWIIIWSIAAIISLLFFFNKMSFLVPLTAGIASLIGFIYLYPPTFEGFSLESGDIKNVELAREAFGLLIIALVLFTYAARIWYKKTTDRLKLFAVFSKK